MLSPLRSLWRGVARRTGLALCRCRQGRPHADLPSLRVEHLEARDCPAITFAFDYSLDTSGFFSNPQHRAALELAGQLMGARLNDSLAAITPAGADTWTGSIQDPSTGATVSLPNLTVPANTLIVYAGGRNYGGNTVGEGGFGGWSASGSSDWFNLVQSRGQAGALASVPTDFGPWGGSLSFDTNTNWNFGDLNTGPAPGQTDFLSVAMHELGHVLGFGTAPSWFAHLQGNQFVGPAVLAAYGTGTYPQVTATHDHWVQTTQDPSAGEADMTPVISVGHRKLFTNLDFAALTDIGWNNSPAAATGGTATPGAVPITLASGGGGTGQTLGVFDPATATWYLRNTNSPGAADITPFAYGAPGWIPLVGDWDGDGKDSIGLYDPATSTWYLRNESSAGFADAGVFQYGLPGWKPVVGDWNGDGKDSIGMYDPATGTWYLRNENSAGLADAGVFQYGLAGWTPVVGDWDGNGHTGIGAVDTSTETWYLRNSASAGFADSVFQYGLPGWTPVVGDWDGNGTTTVGVIDPSTLTWYLRDEASPGLADAGVFAYGMGGWLPLVGDWDGSAKHAAATTFHQAADHSPTAGPGGQQLLRSGHMAGGYCHCAFCQAAAAQARAAQGGPTASASDTQQDMLRALIRLQQDADLFDAPAA